MSFGSSDDTIDVKLMFSTCNLRGASISQWKAWRMLGSSILKGKIISCIIFYNMKDLDVKGWWNQQTKHSAVQVMRLHWRFITDVSGARCMRCETGWPGGSSDALHVSRSISCKHSIFAVWNPFRFIQMVTGAQGREETAGTWQWGKRAAWHIHSSVIRLQKLCKWAHIFSNIYISFIYIHRSRRLGSPIWVFVSLSVFCLMYQGEGGMGLLVKLSVFCGGFQGATAAVFRPWIQVECLASDFGKKLSFSFCVFFPQFGRGNSSKTKIPRQIWLKWSEGQLLQFFGSNEDQYINICKINGGLVFTHQHTHTLDLWISMCSFEFTHI